MTKFIKDVARKVEELLNGSLVLDDWEVPDDAAEIENIPESRSTEIYPSSSFKEFLLSSEDVTIAPPNALRVPLYKHQKDALHWLLWRETQPIKGGILADDMGLGKTLSAIALICKEREMFIPTVDENTTKKKATLIVVPARLAQQWERELAHHVIHPPFTVCLYRGDNRPSNVIQFDNFEVVIATYHGVMNEYQDMKTFKKPAADDFSILFKYEWRRIILDEAHTIRNPDSKFNKSVKDLKTERRLCLTGSPIHNGLQDIVSLLDFQRVNTDHLRKSSLKPEDLRILLEKYMLSRSLENVIRSKSCPRVPTLYIHPVYGKLSGAHAEMYNDVVRSIKPLFCKVMFDENPNARDFPRTLSETLLQAIDAVYKGHDINGKLLSIIEKIRHICAHPGLIITSRNIVAGSKKRVPLVNRFVVELLKESSSEVKKIIGKAHYKTWKVYETLRLTEEILDAGEKVIIVSQWIVHLMIIKYYLEKKGISDVEVITGQVDFDERSKIVETLNAGSSCKILLGCLTSIDEGLNLHGANHIINMDNHWNPQHLLQLAKRIQRIGQTRECHLYSLITQNSIEMHIEDVIKHKLDLSELVKDTGLRQSPCSHEIFPRFFR